MRTPPTCRSILCRSPQTRHRSGLLVALLVAACPGHAGADAIYKSVDADGRVTYSAAPPPQGSTGQVKEMQIQRDPGTESRSPPVEADAPDAKALAAQRANAIKQAQQDLIRATAELEQVKIQGKDDWTLGTNGKKVLSADYTNRVIQAQAKVEAAQQVLKRARRL
ncbi:MAG TPA: DUF4124 domain-containing protein [Lamprocystis sp. (in: g-proteobacteria)]|nr:DUF4124 domain-containing protein [Lamprocystis sp. (in: g-proteobacteria)]